MRLLGREIAREAGCLVIGEARGGEEALARVLEDAPDLVLMDFHMPGIDGAEATARITAARPGVTVVAWTSTDDSAVVRRFAAAGAIAHLVKTDLSGLREILRRLADER
jgi:CheY-like chemotaxis protein